MLRLYLRLYLILALGLAGSIWLVNFGLDTYMPESNETYNREALRDRRGPWWNSCAPCRQRRARPAWTNCNRITACGSNWCNATPRI